MKKNSRAEQICLYVRKKYGTDPEHPWARYPEYTVFRHSDNRKWYAVMMTVPADRLGIESTDRCEILNVRVKDPLLADLLIQQEGFFRGYHMNHSNWISILLDGTVPEEAVFRMLDQSYLATATGANRLKIRPPKEWIVPANPKYYDIEHAFDLRNIIEWKQGSGIRRGDTVYLYVAAPVSAVLFGCTVTETDIPYQYRDDRLIIRNLMRIRLEKKYGSDSFPFERLKDEFGVFAVRGPRGIPERLSRALKEEGIRVS